MSLINNSLTAAALGAVAFGVSPAQADKGFSVGDAEPVVAQRGAAEPSPSAEPTSAGWTVQRGDPVTVSIADACIEASPPPALTPPGSIGAGCFSDRFFVDLPVEAGAYPDGYDVELYTRLNGKKAQVLDWICPDNDMVCRDLSNPLPLTVHQVLDANRAWSVLFDAPVRDDKLCAAVAAIRDSAWEAQKVIAPGAVKPLVGRECAMRIMGGAQSQPSPDMLEWHLRTIGVQGGGPASEPGPSVPVVVLDTGIRAEVGGPLGARTMLDSLDVGGYDPGAQIHPHGTHMAILIDQVSPNAHIHDLRVLDENGHGAISDLAAGLEQVAQSDLFEEGPLVVNMSLGWAPELSRPRTLEGPGCTVQEDPVGEGVRYSLSLLADRGANLPTLVVAAAGNRPHRAAVVDDYYSDIFGVTRDINGPLPPRSNCLAPPSAPTPDWFYPAEWNRRPTCDDQGDPRFLVWAVGATDSQERPGALTIDNAETPVVAPGEHVYVDFPYSDPLPPDACMGDGYPNRLTLPAAVTGSSASAALTSGAAVAAQSRLLKNMAPALSGAGMQRLVWLTGHDITGLGAGQRDPWRPDPANLDPVGLARLNWCGLFHAVEQGTIGGHPDCTALIACADPAVRPAAIIDGDVEATCRAAADTCLASATCAGPQPAAVNWDPSYSAPTTCLEPSACPTAWSDAPPCEATAVGCGYERTIEQHSAAPIGPQPGVIGCPDCAFDAVGQPEVQDPDQAILRGEINSQFVSGTQLLYPYLIVDYLPLGGSVYKRDYIAVAQNGAWEPGDYVKVTDLPDLPAGTGHKVSLWLYIDPPGPGNATSDVSPLRIE